MKKNSNGSPRMTGVAVGSLLALGLVVVGVGSADAAWQAQTTPAIPELRAASLAAPVPQGCQTVLLTGARLTWSASPGADSYELVFVNEATGARVALDVGTVQTVVVTDGLLGGLLSGLGDLLTGSPRTVVTVVAKKGNWSAAADQDPFVLRRGLVTWACA